jgi:hypothetical protein
MTKRVREVNYRRYRARERLAAALVPLGDGLLPAWRLVLTLERLAIKCGVERVLARRSTTWRRR